ncbi:hypothetical protein EYF80_044505 [Liparis tanakae]|uniref:Uncharacterized protein n=1 Tax=Liparis tanakae TaxID=230148 RepID=A0A4Z2FWL6_9TELE|nr:hypothetical protein EYF80_044505 [Liparis tanakae]
MPASRSLADRERLLPVEPDHHGNHDPETRGMTNTRRGGRGERAGGAEEKARFHSLASASPGAERPEIWGQTSRCERSRRYCQEAEWMETEGRGRRGSKETQTASVPRRADPHELPSSTLSLSDIWRSLAPVRSPKLSSRPVVPGREPAAVAL